MLTSIIHDSQIDPEIFPYVLKRPYYSADDFFHTINFLLNKVSITLHLNYKQYSCQFLSFLIKILKTYIFITPYMPVI